MHPEPILRAKICPPELLPTSAARLLKRAESRGLRNRATIAIGYREFGRQGSEDYRPVRSVLVKIQSDKGRIAASWLGDVDGSKMKFDGAWIARTGSGPGKLLFPPDKLGSAELNAEVDAL